MTRENNKSLNNIIFFDGKCGLCHRFVRFVIQKDINQIFHFASLHSKTAKDLLPDTLQSIDSVILLQDGVFYQQSAACFLVLKELKTIWNFVLVFKFLPLKITDFFYNRVARFRFVFFRKQKNCQLLQQKFQDRFI